MSKAKVARCGTGGMESLPQQTLGNILGCLMIKDVCTARKVCSKWRTARATWHIVSDLSMMRLCLFSPTLRMEMSGHTIDTDFAHLPRKLRQLTVSHSKHLTDCGFMHIGALANLQVLELAFLNMTTAGFAHLAGLTHLAHLRLSRCEFDSPHACIGHLATMLSLETLVLSVKDSSVEMDMSRLGQLTNLRSLTLLGANLTDADLEQLASLTNLETFALECCKNATSRGVMFLGQLPHLRKIRFVHVRVVEETWFAAVATSCSLENLEVHSCKTLTSQAVANLASLTSLKRLKLSHCKYLTDAALEALSALTNLQHLSLRGGGILTSAGLVHIAKLSRLETLDLTDCTKISDPGIKHLAVLPKLRLLVVEHCSVTPAGLKFLKNVLPHLETIL